MAAIVLHFNVLETLVRPLRHSNVVIHSDNSPSVAWATTMATKLAQSEAAHRLLHALAKRQRTIEAGPLQLFHIAGKANVLANIVSLVIPNCTDDTFLTHFNLLFPLTRKRKSWRRAYSPMPAQLSNMTLTLRGQRLLQ